MQRLEVSGAVRPIYGALGFKRLNMLCLLIESLLTFRSEVFPTASKSQTEPCKNNLDGRFETSGKT